MGSRSGFTDGRELADLAPKSIVREYAETILICILFIIFLRAFSFQQSEIPSGSMEDTILQGDYILVNRFIYAPTQFDWERRVLPLRSIRHGDVVVFKQPNEPEVDFIKRVVGLPGDTVEWRSGFLYRNGLQVEEPYVGALYRDAEQPDFGPVKVEAGHYFMMGDHRNSSHDSRYFGQVARDLVKGRAFMILFSTNAPQRPGEEAGRVTVMSLFRKILNLMLYLRTDRCLRPIY